MILKIAAMMNLGEDDYDDEEDDGNAVGEENRNTSNTEAEIPK